MENWLFHIFTKYFLDFWLLSESIYLWKIRPDFYNNFSDFGGGVRRPPPHAIASWRVRFSNEENNKYVPLSNICWRFFTNTCTNLNRIVKKLISEIRYRSMSNYCKNKNSRYQWYRKVNLDVWGILPSSCLHNLVLYFLVYLLFELFIRTNDATDESKPLRSILQWIHSFRLHPV